MLTSGRALLKRVGEGVLEEETLEAATESSFLPLAEIRIRKTTTATNRKALKITRSVDRSRLPVMVC